MAQVRRFEFPGRITVFGLTREDAAELLEEVEKVVVALTSVSSVGFTRSQDKKLLAKRGIKVEGEPAGGRKFGSAPPSPATLEEHLDIWRKAKAEDKSRKFERFHDERRREDAEARALRRARKVEDATLQGLAMKNLGVLVKGVRTKSRTTQKALAAAAGADSSWISRLERGLVDPTFSDLFRLSRFLNVPLGDLVGSLDQPHEKPE